MSALNAHQEDELVRLMDKVVHIEERKVIGAITELIGRQAY